MARNYNIAWEIVYEKAIVKIGVAFSHRRE